MGVCSSIYVRKCQSVSSYWDLENRKNTKGLKMKKNFVFDFDEIQNMQSLWPKDFTHKIWVESETKIFSDLMIFWKSEKYQRVPPLEKIIFFVSDFTQILCVRFWDHKDFRFWVSSKKQFWFFFPFSPNVRRPQKFSMSDF